MPLKFLNAKIEINFSRLVSFSKSFVIYNILIHSRYLYIAVWPTSEYTYLETRPNQRSSLIIDH